MAGISLEQIVLYEIAGKPICANGIVVIPTYYEINDFTGFSSIHPFACVEENLQAELEFSPATNDQQGLRIVKIFWELLLTHQGLSEFMDEVLGDNYDDYEFVVMGSNFVTGYQRNEFYLEYI